MRAGNPVIIRADAPLAQKLALASTSGTMWFLLRPAGNAKAPPKKQISTADLQQQITSQPKIAR